VPSDHDIRIDLQAVIEAAAPLAVVFPWWCLGFDLPQWPGMLVSDDDQDRPHGWIITRQAISRAEAANGLTDRRATYAIWCFHYYDTGSEAANSEDLFQAEIDAVADALGAASVSGIHLEPVQFPRILIAKFGEELLHVAQGSMEVVYCG
jgi:hypothetical protein